MATITARNGVNVDQLMATIGAVQQDPNVAAFTFKASSTWRSGARNDGEIKDFVHAGAAALGYVYNAAARGIEISELRYEIEGDLDLHSFLGLEGPRAGFTTIRATSWVKSPNAGKEQLEELCQYVQDTSRGPRLPGEPDPDHDGPRRARLSASQAVVASILAESGKVRRPFQAPR